MKTDSMYKEEIMEIYLEKPNFGKLKEKTHSAKLKNPSCHDEFTIELNIKEGKIKEAGFYGEGCVISTISTALFTKKIKGMNLEDAKKLTKKDIDKIIGIEVIQTKINCELLPLEILRRMK
ncbi:MAG: iron-sulfur cluster assembly scaffold protein [Nanoarchaeota archaeon]|nr:iron-sulfur cluster assembly scaffold protein [Nanoarchaeota archaeon]